MSPSVEVEPGVTFAAHAASRGLVIDKMEGRQGGVLERSTTIASGPQFVLYTAGAPIAALWIDGPDTVVKSVPAAVEIGQVDAEWNERAIRLTFKPQGGETFSTSLFKRIAGGRGPAVLGQPAGSLLDLRGVYEADVVDAAGVPAGWMRVRFTHGWSAHRIYDGVLPAAVGGPLAVAAVARLDAELTAVSRAAVDPYVGN